MKSIGFIARRTGMPMKDFVRYYETCHAPLASRLLKFDRYRRIHIVSGDLLGFAALAEFWCDPQEIAASMAGEAGERLRADELNFMNKAANKAAFAQPILTGNSGNRVSVILLRCKGDISALRDALAKDECSLDILTAFDSRLLPCDAVIFLPRKVEIPFVDGLEMLGRADAIIYEGVGGLFNDEAAAEF